MEQKDKKVRVRSPNYPAITIERAIELVDILYKNQSRYSAALEVASKDWNFSATSSYMAQNIAALSSYGLIEIEGEKENRKIKVSELAYNIVVDKRPESEQRKSLIREAALQPEIFRKIYDAYPSGLPVDHTLEYELVTKYKFNQSSVREFIGILRKTFFYADVYKAGAISSDVASTKTLEISIADKLQMKDTAPIGHITTATSRDSEREIANYPIGKGLKARILISGSSPITAEAIDKLVRLLELNKDDLPETASDGASLDEI